MSAEKVSSRMKLFGVLTIIFGILAIASPWVAGQSILWLVGVLVMAGGLTRMFWAFKAGSFGKGILVFLIGVLTLLAGLAIIAHPIMSAGVFLGIKLLFIGISMMLLGSAAKAVI
jgi:uncharacterized membrane protein HdeD (DUF308 family)